MKHPCYKAIFFLLAICCLCKSVWAQREVPFSYFQTNEETAEKYNGTVEISLIQTRQSGNNYHFSKVDNPIILEVEGDQPGEIIVRFQNVKWERRNQHRNNQLVVNISNLDPPNGLDLPIAGVRVDGRKNSVGELRFPIISNGSGRWTIYFDVLSKEGRETQRAGRIRIGGYKIKYPKAAWQTAKSANSCEAIKHFLAEYPSSPYTSEAQAMKTDLCETRVNALDQAWNRCKQRPDKDCLETFLGTKYDSDAIQRLLLMSERAWDKAQRSNLCKDYQAYVNIWGRGEFEGADVAMANMRLRENTCLSERPKPKARNCPPDCTAEELAWLACRDASGDSVGDACMFYLDNYPAGIHREEAIEKLPPIKSAPFARNQVQTNLFTGQLFYALPPLEVVQVQMGNESATDADAIELDEQGIWQYLGDILTVRFITGNKVEVIAGEKQRFSITLRDSVGREHTFVIDATRPPLKVLSFQEAEDMFSFSLSGGQRPYIIQVVEPGSEEVMWEYTLEETSEGNIVKIDIDPDRKLRGAYGVRFLDVRRTEFVEAPQTIQLQGKISYVWLVLLLLEIGLLIWLYFIFSRRKRAYG